ncbi:hypothetical protein Gotri_016079 [Gossypium trilobum]|uniref:Uncharacterized protein n=1 Tax=Gossypium trilobum TaxID=34281 RepID=A0A7J9E296_9ROSI|nr:hypothetical protein [Gossypium trilobum]
MLALKHLVVDRRLPKPRLNFCLILYLLISPHLAISWCIWLDMTKKSS